MSNLRMPLEDIKKHIRFNPRGFWNNYLTTNCYAFVLGLDIPEEQIASKAYIPGTIGSIVFEIKQNQLIKMSLEQKLYLDLKALDIKYSECSQYERSTDYYKDDYIIYQWVIAVFTGEEKDFHFMRKSWNNEWWHKYGYELERPVNYDDYYEKIINPEKCNIDDSYTYVKCLKLSFKTK